MKSQRFCWKQQWLNEHSAAVHYNEMKTKVRKLIIIKTKISEINSNWTRGPIFKKSYDELTKNLLKSPTYEKILWKT